MPKDDLAFDMDRIHNEYSKPRLEDMKKLVLMEADDMKRDHLLTDIFLYNQALDSQQSARMHNALGRIHKAGYSPIFNRAMYISGLERRVDDAGH